MIKLNTDTFRLSAKSRVFIKIESARRTHILFFPGAVPNTDLHLDLDSKRVYSPECLFYPILNPVATVVGSLYVVNKKKLNFSPTMFYVRETSELGQMEGEQLQGLGGTLVYSDEEQNVLVIPALPIVTDLTVLE